MSDFKIGDRAVLVDPEDSDNYIQGTLVDAGELHPAYRGETRIAFGLRVSEDDPVLPLIDENPYPVWHSEIADGQLRRER